MPNCGGKHATKRKPWWCAVCGSDQDDEVLFGPLCETKNFNVHFFCLLLSGTFEQNGKDKEGVFGFRIKDIEEGLKMIKDIECWYCGHNNASIYCAKPGCRRVFHRTCGVESGCLSQFLGSFESYCHRHNAEFKYKDYKDTTCIVCRDPLGFANDCVENDCCNSVFHRSCLGSLALSSGYFFKCPLCNNTDQFRKCMREKGIFIPDRDASWELEQNAFNDLYTPAFSCEAEVCLSKEGRSFNSANGFAFLSCSSCGAGSVHQKCCGAPDYLCAICRSLYKDVKEETMSTSVIQGMIEAANNNNDDVTADGNGAEDEEEANRRRSTRRSMRRITAESPEKGSPFKARPTPRTNGRLKRRRLC